jgi:transglutaminase-like putative cysteine protease
MRLHVTHETSYRYDTPIASAIQTLHLMPRAHTGLAVVNWRVWSDTRRELPMFVDGYGNFTHCHTVNHLHAAAAVFVEGDVETGATDGIVRGQLEPLPPLFFLRTTALTMADDAIRDLAHRQAPNEGSIGRLHALMGAVGERLAYQAGTTTTTTAAAEALAAGRGVCQDQAHVFIAAARVLGIPARYVGGYLWTGDEPRAYQANHAWAEAYVEDLGWVGFDPSNQICPTESYIRTSVGLDYWSAAPVRGVRRGTAEEVLTVTVRVVPIGGDQ